MILDAIRRNQPRAKEIILRTMSTFATSLARYYMFDHDHLYEDHDGGDLPQPARWQPEEEEEDNTCTMHHLAVMECHKQLNHRVHGLARCTPRRDLASSLTPNYLTNMDLIKAALKDLKL